MTPTEQTPRVQPKGLDFASLTGKLAKRSTTPATADRPTPAPPVAEPTNPPASLPEAGKETAKRVGRAAASSSRETAVGERGGSRTVTTASGRRRVAFTLPVDLRDELVERGRDSTQAEVIFDAIEAHVDDLPELLARANTAYSGGLFERARRTPQQHRVPTTVWMSVQNVSQIDELAATHGAETRTQLLEVVLRRYLQPGN